ncbi:MAG TPA: ribonuclease III [Kiritimatiellia bacterium]|nr:ribonuclease III [Kiritimatiellia bacterium]
MTHPHPLEPCLGYTFQDHRLLQSALTHPSYRYEHPDVAEDNQRMEFLGDAVLGLLAAQFYYLNHPHMQEGDLTAARSVLAGTTALAACARRIQLGPHLRLGRGELNNGGHDRESNLADAVEAILGAAYLDGGLPAAETVFKAIRLHDPDTSAAPRWMENPKGVLQEWTQSQALPLPEYRILREEGPPHLKFYEIQVFLDTTPAGIGSGASKREAEREAALDTLRNDPRLKSMLE